MDGASVLPYRTDALALAEWLAARARGRSAEQLRSAVDSPKAVEGTAAAASALGFTDALEGVLTTRGERYALGEEPERRQLLREALLAYGPYREMLRALSERGGSPETEVRWIEAWWATRGYGSSESNRREGSAAFGRLADFAGLGEYVPGRRGRPTRIRWAASARIPSAGEPVVSPRRTPIAAQTPDLFSAPPPPAPDAKREEARPPRTAAGADPPRAAGRLRDGAAVNRITLPLAGEATARIEVPLRLPAAEKRRLLDLLDLLITET